MLDLYAEEMFVFPESDQVRLGLRNMYQGCQRSGKVGEFHQKSGNSVPGNYWKSHGKVRDFCGAVIVARHT